MPVYLCVVPLITANEKRVHVTTNTNILFRPIFNSVGSEKKMKKSTEINKVMASLRSFCLIILSVARSAVVTVVHPERATIISRIRYLFFKR